MTRETITLTREEQRRLMVLTEVRAGHLLARQAAQVLGLSLRHCRRLLARFRHRGAAALAHRNRGRARFRRRRERMPQSGLLLQWDGSHHAWLEGRGPRLVLHGAIDDATNEVPAATFRAQEEASGYFVVLRELIRTHGIPVALYGERHGIVTNDARPRPLTLDEQLRGHTRPLTQAGRALHELGIHWVPAHSPQAKGRVERLWGTFQDRLRRGTPPAPRPP